MAGKLGLPSKPTHKKDQLALIKRGPVPRHLRWQTWYDSWRDRERSCRWYGRCVVCGRNCWAFDDGENDPRGVLGDNALWTTDADAEEEFEIRTCAICANDHESYLTARRLFVLEGAEAVRPIVWPKGEPA